MIDRTPIDKSVATDRPPHCDKDDERAVRCVEEIVVSWLEEPLFGIMQRHGLQWPERPAGYAAFARRSRLHK